MFVSWGCFSMIKAFFKRKKKVEISICTWIFSQDIFKQATEDRLTSAKELPYFEGDFWPNVLEESIKELEQEEEERKREENTSNESTDVRVSGDLSQKLYATMERHKEVRWGLQEWQNKTIHHCCQSWHVSCSHIPHNAVFLVIDGLHMQRRVP